MLFVEDLLHLIVTRVNDFQSDFQTFGGLLDDPWHRSFLANVNTHVVRGSPLSTEQGKIVMKIINKVKTHLVKDEHIDERALEALIHSPSYKKTPYQSTTIKKEVRHLGGNKLGFRFKFNEVVINDLREIGDLTNGPAPYFDRDHRIWVVTLNSETWPYTQKLVSTHRFEMDQSTLEWWRLAQHSVKASSTIVLDDETGYLIVNVCDNAALSQWMTQIGGAQPI